MLLINPSKLLGFEAMNISQRMQFETGALNLLDHKPERLFVNGFRCVVSGYEFADIECWEAAWNAYCLELDVVTARKLLSEVQYFVRVLRGYGPPGLSIFPHVCSRLSHDESKILNLIVCMQQGDRSAAASASALVLGNRGSTDAVNLAPLVGAAGAVGAAFEEAVLHFVPLGQDVLDQLTGASNEGCGGCPAGGALWI
jgi:hypothetical protein